MTDMFPRQKEELILLLVKEMVGIAELEERPADDTPQQNPKVRTVSFDSSFHNAKIAHFSQTAKNVLSFFCFMKD